MYSACDDIRLGMPGCPIRRSPDQSLLSGSPRLIAASHVLHRLLAPRHPPCALSSLTRNARAPMRLHSPATRTHYSVVKEHRHHPLTTSVRSLFDFSGADGHRTH